MYLLHCKFNGKTPKRHRLWGNDRRLLRLVHVQAGYMSRSEQSKCPGQTVRKYIDRNGKKRHVGIKGALTDSQYFVLHFSPRMCCFEWSMTTHNNPDVITSYTICVPGLWSLSLSLELRHFTKEFGEFIARCIQEPPVFGSNSISLSTHVFVEIGIYKKYIYII